MENYWNYFTEIEECFRRCRGTPTLLSTLDWALIESWKEANIPLEAVLNGVERTFQERSKRANRYRKVNGLAYCAQAVFEAADELNTALIESGAHPRSQAHTGASFPTDEVHAYLARNIEALEKASSACQVNGDAVLAQDLQDGAASLCEIASRDDCAENLESLEQSLSALEEKLNAALTRATPVAVLAEVHREIDRGLASCRRKMTAPQIESLQRQFLKKNLFEHYAIPRLSLFYL